MRKFVWFMVAVLLSSTVAFAKQKEKEDEKKDEEKAFINSGLVSSLKFRSIGPAWASGRIADFAVNPKNTKEYYVAVASGHVWKTTNNGTTWSPIFDNYGAYSIADVEIDPNNYIINADGAIVENTSLVGIEEEPESELTIYPSPATTELTVESAETNNYQLINTMGQVVSTGNLVAGKNIIDISNLSTGVYLIKTSSGQKRFVKK